MSCLPPTNLPRLNRAWFRNLCHLGPRPLVATGWFLQWLRGHFGSAQTIQETEGSLPSSIWSANVDTTRIAIESVTRWVDSLTEDRPAVIVKRNAWKRMRLGINDLKTVTREGHRIHSNLWLGSHTLFCIAGEGGEAEILGAEVFHELNQFGPNIREILDLMRFEVMEVGEVLKLKQNAKENFVVPITASYAYREDWKVVPEAPLIKRLDLASFQP